MGGYVVVVEGSLVASGRRGGDSFGLELCTICV